MTDTTSDIQLLDDHEPRPIEPFEQSFPSSHKHQVEVPFGDETLQIFDAAKVEAGGRCGEVTAITDEGIVVTAGRGGVLVKRVRHGAGGKVAAADFAKEVGLEVGAKLGG